MPKLGLDEQKPDRRPTAPGNAAMDAEARWSFGGGVGKSGEARVKDVRLNLGGLAACRAIRLSRQQCHETSGEKSAEVVVAHCIARKRLLASEGPNSFLQGAV
jgi:hypothetical protein